MSTYDNPATNEQLTSRHEREGLAHEQAASLRAEYDALQVRSAEIREQLEQINTDFSDVRKVEYNSDGSEIVVEPNGDRWERVDSVGRCYASKNDSEIGLFSYLD